MMQRKIGAASQIRTGDLILTNFECNLLMECLLMPADAPKAIVIHRFSKITAIPRLCQRTPYFSVMIGKNGAFFCVCRKK